jgi:hypothetical protein
MPIKVGQADQEGYSLKRCELFGGLADGKVGIILRQFIDLLPEGSILRLSQNLHGANSGMRIC